MVAKLSYIKNSRFFWPTLYKNTKYLKYST